MVELANKELCTGCTACMAACPQGCICMREDAEGFEFPQIDEAKCVSCGKCAKVCPVMHLQKQTASAPMAYAAQNRQEQIRMSSSSGGVFTLLAELVIAKGGVVFGAALTEQCELRHIAVETLADLEKLRGSKYLQSRMGDAYRQARAFLRQGRPVLFTGTACQIAGLKAFLGRDYEQLLCQDIVCYGVPSPGVWRRYIDELQAKEGRKLCGVNFRNKSTGWRTYSVTYRFEDGTERTVPSANDPFLRGFLDNLYLRQSCENCRSKNSQADITIGDCWGLERIAPEMDDERGTSVVLIHTPKGAQAFEAIKDRLTYRQVDYARIIERNRAIYASAQHNKKRNNYFSQQDQPFEETIDKLTKVTFLTRWKLRFRALLRRLLHR